jgi:hypothetical protein
VTSPARAADSSIAGLLAATPAEKYQAILPPPAVAPMSMLMAYPGILARFRREIGSLFAAALALNPKAWHAPLPG